MRHVGPALLVGFGVLAYDAALLVVAARPTRRDLVLAGLTTLIAGVAAVRISTDTADPLHATTGDHAPGVACRSEIPWSTGPWPDCMRLTVLRGPHPPAGWPSPMTVVPLPSTGR